MRFGPKQICAATCAILSLTTVGDTAHALGTTIVATGVASCKIVLDIQNPNPKRATLNTCDGTASSAVATNLSPTVLLGSTVPWLAEKPTPKRKDNFSCYNIQYEEDWIALGPEVINGECVVFSNVGSDMLHFSFEYARIGTVALTEFPAKKPVGWWANGDNSIYTVIGGTKTTCPAGNNPEGAGVFVVIPKGVPSKTTEMWLTGVFAIDC